MVFSLTFFGEKNQNKTQPSVAKQTCPPCLGLAFMTGKSSPKFRSIQNGHQTGSEKSQH